MFKFLFRNRGGAAEPVRETQRQTFERALGELNEIIDAMPDKPRVTLDPASGHVSFEMPEQFPDEARALPAPQTPSPSSPKAASPLPDTPGPKAPKPAASEPREPEPKTPGPKVPEPRVRESKAGQ